MTYLRMKCKHALLEIVGQFLSPGFNGLHDYLAAVLGGVMGMNAGECFLGGYGDIRAHDADVPAVQLQANGLKPFTDAFGVARTAKNEKGTVSAQACRIVHHLFVGESQSEHFIQQTNGIGTVAGASAHTSLSGNTLMQVSLNTR